MKTEKRMPTNKELGIKPTKKDRAAADEIVRSAGRTVEATDMKIVEARP